MTSLKIPIISNPSVDIYHASVLIWQEDHLFTQKEPSAKDAYQRRWYSIRKRALALYFFFYPSSDSHFKKHSFIKRQMRATRLKMEFPLWKKAGWSLGCAHVWITSHCFMDSKKEWMRSLCDKREREECFQNLIQLRFLRSTLIKFKFIFG